MKFVALFAAVAAVASLVSGGPEVNSSRTNIDVWKEGKVSYEMAKEFDDGESTLIKECLTELMKTTCVQFTPRFNNEVDYVVFAKYKHPTQEHGSCWSGKWIDGINSTIGNKKGRHIFSLWPDLACFNKFDIIRGLVNILGFQTKPIIKDRNNNRNKKQIFYVLFGSRTYEDNFERLFTHHNGFLKTSCKNDTIVFKNHPFALDKEELMLAAIRDSCGALRKILEINQLYHCPLTNASSEVDNMDATSLAAIAPNCLAEASAGTCKTDQTYMSAVCDKSFCDVTKQKPSTAHLRNGHGKFLASSENSDGDGNLLIQWGYKAEEKGQQWSWNQDTLGSKERHICNGHGKCAASPENNPSRTYLIQWENLDESGQKYNFLNSPRPGFYIIKNDFGNCLGVDGEDAIIVDNCNSSDNGQHWQWYKM